MKELCYTILSKPVAQGFINCWFSYLLAQPVDIDLSVLLYFIMQYFGVVKVFQLFEKGKGYFHASHSPTNDPKDPTMDNGLPAFIR